MHQIDLSKIKLALFVNLPHYVYGKPMKMRPHVYQLSPKNNYLSPSVGYCATKVVDTLYNTYLSLVTLAAQLC